MNDEKKYGYSPFDDELQMQDKREAWKDKRIATLEVAIDNWRKSRRSDTTTEAEAALMDATDGR